MAAVEEVTSDAVLFDSDGNILSSGTTLSGATITNGGSMIVADKGTAEETTVSSGGQMTVSSGGMASDTEVLIGGSMLISSGGVADSTTVSSGGKIYVSNGGVANSTTVSSGGSMCISSGGVANSTTVNAGGRMYISSGGTATDVIWTPCVGRVIEAEGAYVTYVSQYSGVYFGTTNCISMDNKIVYATSMYVMSGGEIDSTTVSGGYHGHSYLYISSGGVANNTSVDFRGNMYISSDGVANHTTVNADGSMTISSGGVANSTTVNSSGYMTIFSGGVANSTTVNSKGCVFIDSGGSAIDIITSYGGSLCFSVTSNTYIQGRCHDGVVFEMKDAVLKGYYCYGSVWVPSGGVVNDTAIGRGGYMYIASGGTATNVLEDGGYVEVVDGAEVEFLANTLNGLTVNRAMTVHSNTVVNRCTVEYSGSMFISSGGVANSTIARYGANVYIFYGGTVNSTTVDGAGAFMYISSGGVANSTTVKGDVASGSTVDGPGAFVIISNGGMANSTEVIADGRMHITSGGVANSTIVKGGGMYISSGGTHRGSLQLNAGAVVSAYEGSTIDFTLTDRTPEDGYLINDLSLITGAPTYTITVSADQALGTYKLAQGASAFTGSITIGTETETYGTLTVNGAELNHQDAIYSLVKDEGNLLLKIDQPAVFIYSSGTLTSAGMEVSGVILSASNSMHITSGGTAFNTEVKSKGAMYISRGGIAVDTILSGGTMLNGGVIPIPGEMHVYDGGVANNTVVSAYASAHISSGGMLNNTTVYDNGCLFVCSSGIAQKTEINWGRVSISSGGIATDTAVNCGGTMRISSGGVASDTTLDAASYLYVLDGGIASNTVNGGFIHISSGGTANSTTVNPKGKVYISSGGTATEVKENGGFVDIEDGAEVTFVSNTFSGARLSAALAATVHSGTTALDTVITDSATMFIFSGGVANGTTMESSATMRIFSGGVANGTTMESRATMRIFSGGITNNTIVSGYSATIYISSGGVANSTTVKSGGSMLVSGGVASDTMVSSGGNMTIFEGGVASDTTVTSGGKMYLSSGSVHRGELQIASGAVVSAYECSTIDFTLTDRKPEDGYLINDLSLIQGAPDHTITISVDQAVGMYNLAQGASSFTGMITIGTEMKQYGTLTVNGEALRSGDLSFSLLNTDGNLQLNVRNHNIIISAGSVISGTQVNDEKLTVPNGAVTSDTTVNSGGSMLVSGGVANNTTVNPWGFMFIFNRGVANNTAVSGGRITISSGGVANSTTVVDSSGRMYILYGGVANSTTVSSGGLMCVLHGVATSTTVSSGGSMNVSSSGVVSDTTVTSGGSMFVSSGGVHRGGLQIASGAVVSAYEGSTIDFTLTDRTVEDGYLINDLSLIQGAPTYTITVSADQAAGTYKLAQGASSFTGTITIGTETETYGTLTVNGEAFIHNEKKYTLTQNGEDLQLFISPLDSEAPVRGKIALKQSDQNSVKVTISGFTDNVKIARYDVYVSGKKVGSTTGTTYTYKSGANLTAGAKSFAVKAIDTAGNISTSASAKLTVNLAVVGKATSKSTVLTWKAASVAGGRKQYEVVVSGKKYISTTNKITIKGLAVGSRSVTVYARSKTNKLTTLDSGDIIKVTDGTAPTGGKVVAAQSGQKNIKVTISGFKDNVKVTKYYVYVSGRKVATTTSTSYTYKSSVNLIGKKTVMVKAVDAAGNISVGKSVAITIKDVTAPSKVTGLKVSGTPTQASAKLVWTKGVDNVGVTKYAVKVSGVSKTYTTTTNSLVVKGLTAGKHTYQVYAYDATGRKSVVSTAYSFNVKDITKPTGGKITLKQASQNSVKITISSFKDNVKVGKYYVYLNGKKIATTTSTTYTYTQSANFTTSKLTFAVKAVDTTGNVSVSKSAAFAAKVRVSGKATNLSTVLTWTKPAISGTLKRYEITVSGKKYTSTTNKITIKGLAVGTRSVTIKAINTSNQSKTVCSGELIKVVTATVNKTISGITDGVKDVNGITGSAANDIVTFQKDRDFNLLSDISLGSGDDKLIIPTADDCPGIAFENGAGIDFGAGNDTLELGANALLGYCDQLAGDDIFAEKDLASGYLDFGTGNDTLRMGTYSECDTNSISFGDGNDVFQLDDDALFDFPSPGTVAFGAGNDKMILGNDVNLGVYESTLTLDFGSGTDTMTFDGKVHIHADQLLITGLENITGSGSLVLVDGCTLDDETKNKFEQAGISVTLA